MDNKGLFKNIHRKTADKLSTKERIKNHKEFYIHQNYENIKKQASRCMDCGVSFCNYACPLGNSLPELNELVIEDNWEKALEILLETNNFPEFTGRLCPALCEGSCSLIIDHCSVKTKDNELSIIERGFEKNYVKAMKPKFRMGKSVAVIGSGPSGLAVAQELNKKGVNVTVYEKDYEPGGLLRLGIPDYKIEKSIIDRRINLLKEEGIEFICNTEIGVDIEIQELLESFDGICLANGFTVPREIKAEGNELKGIHFALDYLKQQNLLNAGKDLEDDLINAKDKNVLIIGGGDTGADCLGIAIRQGAKSIHQIEILSKPPQERSSKTPWPYWPYMLRKNTAHGEGGERSWDTLTQGFKGEDHIKSVICSKVKWQSIDGKMNMTIEEDSNYKIDADLVIIAAGFIDTKNYEMYETLGVEFGKRNSILTEKHMTNVEGIFATGDLKNGPSLICKAISDGREASKTIYNYLK